MSALTDLSVSQALDGMRRGEFSSLELTRACLEKIDALEPQLHAFLTLTPDLALAQAAAADRSMAEWRRSPTQTLAPLLGVPATPVPQGFVLKMAELSRGKDTPTGHWEMVGVQTTSFSLAR